MRLVDTYVLAATYSFLLGGCLGGAMAFMSTSFDVFESSYKTRQMRQHTDLISKAMHSASDSASVSIATLVGFGAGGLTAVGILTVSPVVVPYLCANRVLNSNNSTPTKEIY